MKKGFVNIYKEKIGKTVFASKPEAKEGRCPNSTFLGVVKIKLLEAGKYTIADHSFYRVE